MPLLFIGIVKRRLLQSFGRDVAQLVPALKVTLVLLEPAYLCNRASENVLCQLQDAT